MSTPEATQQAPETRIVTLTNEQAMRWSMNTENELAWRIASGLADWMQFCCAKLVGHLIREDPARMALVEILQAQRGDKRLSINALPMGWRGGPSNERVDVCLGADRTPGSAGVIELKWLRSVEEGNRIETRIDLIQDIARLASVQTTEPPHARYFVLGLMEGTAEPILGKKHVKSADREAQRKAYGNLLSYDPRYPERTVALDELARIMHVVPRARTPWV